MKVKGGLFGKRKRTSKGREEGQVRIMGEVNMAKIHYIHT
jgi:hypothetical protein